MLMFSYLSYPKKIKRHSGIFPYVSCYEVNKDQPIIKISVKEKVKRMLFLFLFFYFFEIFFVFFKFGKTKFFFSSKFFNWLACINLTIARAC